MTTKKTTYDFDAWDEAAEDAAITEAAKAADVRYILVEGRLFVAKFPGGRIIETPLKISLADIEAIQSETDDQIEQIKTLLAMLGQDDDLAYLAQESLTSVSIFAEKYFRVFARIAGAALGE